MSDPRTALWARLARSNLVQGEMPIRESLATPWYVRTMLGVAGWTGALFLSGFLVTGLDLFRAGPGASLLAGAIACVAAMAMFRAQPKNDFVVQFAFAVSLAGQALILLGIAMPIHSDMALAALVTAAVQTALFFLISNFMHRVWCAWAASLAVAFAFASWHIPFYAPALFTALLAWIWLSDGPIRVTVGAQWRAGGYGIALGLVQTLLFMDSGAMRWFLSSAPDRHWHMWVGAALTSIVWLGVVAALLRREAAVAGRYNRRLALVGGLIVALATLKAPGLAPLVAVLLLGFANGTRTLVGLGALALLGYGIHYYYALEVSLLEKSMLLAATGIALLLARLAMNRHRPAEVNSHA